MKRLVLVAALLLAGAGCQPVQANRDTFPQPRVGSSAEFQSYPRWDVSGRVVVLDERTLRFEGFTFHGDRLSAHLLLLKNRRSLGELRNLTNEQLDNATFDIALPDGITIADFNLVVIYSPDLQAPVTGAKFAL